MINSFIKAFKGLNCLHNYRTLFNCGFLSINVLRIIILSFFISLNISASHAQANMSSDSTLRGNCEDIEPFEIEINGSDIGCTDDFTTLTASPIPEDITGLSYFWEYSSDSTDGINGTWEPAIDDGDPDNDDATYNATEIGWYSVTAILDEKCKVSDVIEIGKKKFDDIIAECSYLIWECTSEVTLDFAFYDWLFSFSHTGGGENQIVTYKYALDSSTDYENAIAIINNLSEIPPPSDPCASYFLRLWYDVVDDCTDPYAEPNRCSGFFVVLPDTENPAFTVPDDITIECDQDQTNLELTGDVTDEADNCSTGLEATFSDSVADDSCANEYVITRTWLLTDDCGNTTTSDQTISVVDTTAPVIDPEASNLEVMCDGDDENNELQEWLDTNGGAVASDNCGDVTWTNDYDGANSDCSVPVLVTFTATDACGNFASTSASYIIPEDDTPPTIDTEAGDAFVECDGSGNINELQDWLNNNGGAVASDDCSSIMWSNDFEVLSDECGATGSATITFTATDGCGNENSTSATFTIVDITSPTIDTEADDASVECDGAGNAADLQDWLNNNGGAVASDNCSSITWSNDFDALSDECGATGSATITFTAKDDCENASSTSATFTIVDMTPPTIDIEADDISVECDGEGNNTALQEWLDLNGGASASDVCGDVTWSNDFDGETSDCSAPVLVTFTATDACGNSASTSAFYSIQDDTPPTIDIEASDVDVVCDGENTDLQDWLDSNGGAVASDNCSEVTWSNNYDGSLSDCSEPVEVTFTATDACGNSASTSASYTIQDTTPPTIDTEAGDASVECDGDGNTADIQDWLDNNGGAVASDDCSSITWSNDFEALSDECGATGSATVTFTATDGCGNENSTSATFTIVDTIDPVIDVEASDLDVVCDGEGNNTDLQEWLVNNGGASASDVCSDVSWSNDFDGATSDCSAPVLVTFIATDACGNSASTSAFYSIQDDTPPTIDTEASDVEVVCDGENTDLQDWLDSNGGAVTSDNCSDVTWANDYDGANSDCSAPVLVTFTASDACGNSASTSASYTIQDTTPPTIDTEASNASVECDGDGNTADLNDWLNNNGGAVASDDCSSITWSNDFEELSDECGATGSATVTFTATDGCGNENSTSATFTIVDMTSPTIDTEADDASVECDGGSNAADLQDWLNNNGGAVASDNCSSITWSNDFDALSDECGATGSATVTFTATDDCGNASSTSATFTIVDTTDPVIEIEASDVDVVCEGDGDNTDLQDWLDSNGGAVASDVCSNVSWTNDFATSDCSGPVLVTFIALDACGNATSTSATYTIQDTTPPTLNVPEDYSVECLEDVPECDINDASATDNCSDVIITCDQVQVEGDTIINTYTATDACGNTTTATQTITMTADGIEGGTQDLCNIGDLPFDLFELLSDFIEGGTWEQTDPDSPVVPLEGSIIDPLNVPEGVYEFTYSVSGDVCPIKVRVNIIQEPCIDPCFIIGETDISRMVTPNGDSYNEYFLVADFGDNVDNLCKIHLQIFNRWGAKIYESDNYQNDWNGIAHRNSVGSSNIVPTGTYFYIIQLTLPGQIGETHTGYFYLAAK